MTYYVLSRVTRSSRSRGPETRYDVVTIDTFSAEAAAYSFLYGEQNTFPSTVQSFADNCLVGVDGFPELCKFQDESRLVIAGPTRASVCEAYFNGLIASNPKPAPAHL